MEKKYKNVYKVYFTSLYKVFLLNSSVITLLKEL